MEASTTGGVASGAIGFGRLEPLKIRDYWKDEARDFTPWLAQEENLTLLGETIGLNLELIGMEQRVGPFAADIVASDGEHRVIIENQLEQTDHRHLGQLLVYAAGRNATRVVWVARQVTDEHREVIDWLNRETTVRFWALEIELWRIGESAPAPKFNVVCEPNELSEPAGTDAAPLTATKLLQLDFWKGFAEYLETSGSSFNARKPYPRHWYDLSIGTSRAHISLSALVARNGRLGCELYIGHSHADAIYEALADEREAVEAEVGETLDWQPLPEKKSSRVALYRDADIENRDAWPQLYMWLKDRAETFKKTFGDRVKHVDLPRPVAAEVHENLDGAPLDTTLIDGLDALTTPEASPAEASSAPQNGS